MKLLIAIIFILPFYLSARNLPDPNELPEGVIELFDSKYGFEYYTDIKGLFDDSEFSEIDHIILHIGPLGRYDFIKKYFYCGVVISIITLLLILIQKKNKTEPTN